jgi:hypothetical protein
VRDAILASTLGEAHARAVEENLRDATRALLRGGRR